MSGHSKWSNIKHKKATQDSKRSKVFAKLIREISVAARDGGCEPDMNPRLRLAIQKAYSVNMPKDNVQRAIQRGTGSKKGEGMEELTYECYGPFGVPIIVDVITDNNKRSVSDIRGLLNKYHGSFNACRHAFRQIGVLHIEVDSMIDENIITEYALEYEADDLKNISDKRYMIFLSPKNYYACYDFLSKNNQINISEESGVRMIAKNPVNLSLEEYETINKLVDSLHDLDDVQDIFTGVNNENSWD